MNKLETALIAGIRAFMDVYNADESGESALTVSYTPPPAPVIIPAGTVVTPELLGTMISTAAILDAQPVPPKDEAFEVTPYDRVMDALNDPRFTYRTVDVLIEAAGVTLPHELYDFLNRNGIDYKTVRRRSDNAQLIGLRERN